MICFYREHNGDYLAIDISTNAYYLNNFGKDQYQGRATAIENLVGSVCMLTALKNRASFAL